MKIQPSERKLTEMSVERERPDDWLKNALRLHSFWQVQVDEAARAVDSHWSAFEKVISDAFGMSKPISETHGLDLFAPIFKDRPSDLYRTLMANPEIMAQIDSLGTDGHERVADKVSKAKKRSKKTFAKLPRTWRTLCIGCWSVDCAQWPPFCLLSDMAIIDLFAREDDLVGGEAIRQEISRLGLYRPTWPRIGVQHHGKNFRWVIQHSGVTRKD